VCNGQSGERGGKGEGGRGCVRVGNGTHIMEKRSACRCSSLNGRLELRVQTYGGCNGRTISEAMVDGGRERERDLRERRKIKGGS
jgi:hypothetical protein